MNKAEQLNQYIKLLKKRKRLLEKSPNSLLSFVRLNNEKYRAGAHHKLLISKLEEVAAGKLKRLMVFMPPRHGKSELVSRYFPAWWMGNHPEGQFILSSYNASLAENFGRDIREILNSKSFNLVFPDVCLSTDSKAKNLWRTNKNGVFLASGIGGSMTGFGGNIVVIDDPVKDRQEANSETVRNSVWDWYKTVPRTRLMGNGAIVLVMTRWHIDDLAGRLLVEMEHGGDKWEVIKLPAFAEENDLLGRPPGEALWPSFFNKEVLETTKSSIGELDFEALYQCNPILTEGSIFKTDQIKIIDAIPPSAQKVRRWDFAASKDFGRYDSDYTVGLLMQRNKDKTYCILDVVRFRGLPDEVERRVRQTAELDGTDVPIIIPQDPGQAGVFQSQHYVKLLAGFNVKSERETGSKTERANPLAAQVNVGNFSIVRGTWNKIFLQELAAFPSDAHDDQVDACSGAFNELALKTRLFFPSMPKINMNNYFNEIYI